MTRVWHKHCGPLPTPSVGLTTFPKVSLLPRVVSILFVCLEIDGSTLFLNYSHCDPLFIPPFLVCPAFNVRYSCLLGVRPNAHLQFMPCIGQCECGTALPFP